MHINEPGPTAEWTRYTLNKYQPEFSPSRFRIKLNLSSMQFSYDYPKGNRSYIYLFIAAGIFIFFIATLNYTSLFSSSLTARIRSLGICKINGAIGRQIYKLLISESIIVILVSALISIFLITAFNTYTNGLIVQAPL